MKSTPFYLIGPAILALAIGQTIAQDETETAKAAPEITASDVAGSWSWTAPGFGGQEIDAELTLKQSGAEISGTYNGRRGETKIEGGKVEGDSISFNYVRSFGDNDFTTTFAGKVQEGEIVGKITSPGRDGDTRETYWHADKDPEINPSGLWKWSRTSGRDGSQRHSWVKLAYAKGKLTGVYRTTRSQAPIKEATLNGKEIAFKVERGGRTRTSTTSYKGTLDSSAIKGTITSRRGEEDRTADWAAARETPKVDAVGSWTWTSRFGRNGEEVTNTLALKQEGDALTGTLDGRSGESAIADAKLSGDEVTFNVSTENDRGNFTSAYTATIDEDILKGSIATKSGERSFERPFRASRVLPKPEPVGAWKWSTRGWGAAASDTENALTLTMTDGKLGGTYASGDNSSAIEDAKLDKNTLTFKVQRTIRDQERTMNYTGQFRGDVLKGHYSVGENTSGSVTLWEAKKSSE